MRSERRHELQTNDLAAVVSRWVENNRGHLPLILVAAAAIVLVAVAIQVWAGRDAAKQANAWADLDQASYGSTDEDVVRRLRSVIEDYPNQDAALWAKLDLADFRISEGRRELLQNPNTARLRIDEARKLYEQVLNSPDASSLMIQRAAIPSAATWEIEGERDKAIAAYEKLAERFKGNAIGQEAEGRAKGLRSTDAADFYRWLADYKPPKPAGDVKLPPDIFGDDLSKDALKDATTTTPAEEQPAEKKQEEGTSKPDASGEGKVEPPAQTPAESPDTAETPAKAPAAPVENPTPPEKPDKSAAEPPKE